MRTRALYNTFSNSQKFRVIIEGVHFIATTKDLQDSGRMSQTNAQLASLASLDASRLANPAVTGHSGRWCGLCVQLDIII